MKHRRHPNVVNASEVAPETILQGKHHIEDRTLGEAAGARLLGASLMAIPPGAVGYPFHYHCAVEESLFIVSGTGTARIGGQRVAVGAGDFVAYPVGPAHAHQMINDGSEPLVYLCISTQANADICVYPDSKKIAARAGTAEDGPWVHTMAREDDPRLPYFHGEPDA